MPRLPKLNSYVFVIVYVDDKPYYIMRDRVYMKNKNAFITEEMLSDYIIDEGREELTLDNYGKLWTKTFAEAKAVIKKCEDYDRQFDKTLRYYIIKSIHGGVWSVCTLK